MPPSQIQIATQSLQRLVKEEASYFKEQEQQEKRIAKLEQSNSDDEDGNKEFTLKQEVGAEEPFTLTSAASCLQWDGMSSITMNPKYNWRNLNDHQHGFCSAWYEPVIQEHSHRPQQHNNKQFRHQFPLPQCEILTGFALQRRALEETKAVIPTFRERITSAREKLESVLVSNPIPYDVCQAHVL